MDQDAQRPDAAITQGTGPRRVGGWKVSKKWHRVAVFFMLVAVILWTWNQWGLRGLIVPVRVVSGSMAETLPGPHFQVDCQACRFPFRCGTDHPPGDLAVCPNCGFARNRLNQAGHTRGQRVLIDQFSTFLRAPRRWEVVVARLPSDPSRLTVKRVVGLPGEHIRIRHGDIYVDGTMLRKSIQQQRKMSVLVHDDRFRPSMAVEHHPRWRPQSERSRWQQQSGRFCYSPAKPPDNVPVAFSANKTIHADDWLVYHHWPCPSMAAGRARESPVTDNCSYNQGLSRKLSEVTDLILTCRVRTSGSGLLAVLAHDGREAFQIHCDLGRGQVRLLRQGMTVAQAPQRSTPWDREVLMEAMICDRRIQLALDGHTVLAYTYAATELPLRATSQPLAIGVVDATVEVTHLCVWRDVYYTHPQAVVADWSMAGPLAEDEYFLLGDNSPISVDSRHATRQRRVTRRDILGRVLPEPKTGTLEPHPRGGVRR